MLSRNLTKEDCEKWDKNKTKNPITNRVIREKSALYQKIAKQCGEVNNADKTKNADKTVKSQKNVKSLVAKNNQYTLQDCLIWEKNKSRNPKTKYSLGDKSKIKKKIEETCIPVLENYYKNKTLTIKPVTTDLSIQVSPFQNDYDSLASSKKPDIKTINKSDQFELHYPLLDDPQFQNKIAGLYELYKVAKYDQVKSKEDFERKANQLCGQFEKTLYQYFISNYISSRTPYKGVLLYHGVGVGKTCSSITLAEGFLTTHSMNDEPKIWVVMPSALRTSFKEQIFSIDNIDNYDFLANQCTGDSYIKMANILRNSNREKIEQTIKKLIKSRYRLFTYDKFATFIEDNYISKNIPITDKVIIVDEAHNIRSKSSSNKENDENKRVYSSLLNIVSTGNNNRLVLLSATPMYDQPEDIFDLLYLLDLNDKRGILTQPFPPMFNKDNTINPTTHQIIKTLSSNYISYLRGKNPFTFAIKLSPQKFLPKLRFLTSEPKFDSNKKPIDSIYHNWLSEIDESIVLSNFGNVQHEYVNKIKLLDDNHLFKNRQPMNIVFQNDVGEKGFAEFFITNQESNTLSVKYKKKYMNALLPNENNLGKYSGKFLNLCNILKNSKGIVIIYSGYIWSGVIPIATCLEHMGFNREGSNNILKNPDIIDDPPLYGNNKKPSYCIMTSDQKEIMGSSTVDKLLKIVNNPLNVDGSLIKVVLMTPVASEGLSFYNVREMHIIDPWFHMNKNDQVVGRGIRNCRHQLLPLEERNVSVFLHASYENDEIETADITSYRISSKKLLQTKKIDKLIKDNAVDCHLMKNINYFPKNLFELGNITISTSQGKKIDYQYGDDYSQEPQCNYKEITRDIQKFRKDSNYHFINALKKKIKSLVLQHIDKQSSFIPLNDILENLNFDTTISLNAINQSLHPNMILDGYMLIPYNDSIQIVKTQPEITQKLKLINKPKEKSPKPSKKYKKNKLEEISKKDINIASLELYLTMIPATFEGFVHDIIEKNILNTTETHIANFFYLQGALIKSNEIPNSKNIANSKNEYIGYVDIFESKFKPLVLSDNNVYRELTPNELSILIEKRKHVTKPNDIDEETNTWGMITPVFNKKEKTSKNVLKLFITGPRKGQKTGIDCSSLLKKKHQEILQEYGVEVQKNDTKLQNCKNIAIQLMMNKRMILLPEYKPKL